MAERPLALPPDIGREKPVGAPEWNIDISRICEELLRLRRVALESASAAMEARVTAEDALVTSRTLLAEANGLLQPKANAPVFSPPQVGDCPI